jgi:hypothetical protein
MVITQEKNPGGIWYNLVICYGYYTRLVTWLTNQLSTAMNFQFLVYRNITIYRYGNILHLPFVDIYPRSDQVYQRHLHIFTYNYVNNL